VRISVILLSASCFVILALLGQTSSPETKLPSGIGEVERDTTRPSRPLELTPLPDWAQPGQFTFMRMDGGVLEREKARRSNYGRSFSSEESEILGNLYTTHAERIISLMKQAAVTVVWIDWSVGWSREFESSQWTVMRGLIHRLHSENIRVIAYLCATSIFWQNMFMDEPRSVTWLAFLPSNTRVPLGIAVGRPPYPFMPDWTPVSYGTRSSFRYLADLGNSEWREYVKMRVSEALDAGADGIFFDNPLVAHPRMYEAVGFFSDIQRHIKNTKNNPALMSIHLQPWSTETVALNDLCEQVFVQWGEVGMVGGKERTNIPFSRLQRSFIADKSLYGELIAASSFPPSGTSGIPSARLEKIAMAEAAATQCALGNRVFGPFLKGIIQNEPVALESWSAIGQYNRFVLSHPQLYAKMQVSPDMLVVIEDPITRGEISPFLDFLTRQNIQFDVCVLSRLSTGIVQGHRAITLVGLDHLSSNQTSLLESYRRSGGKIYSLGGLRAENAPIDLQSSTLTLSTLETSEKSKTEVLGNLGQLIKNRKIRVANSRQVVAVVTKATTCDRAVIHFVNHSEQPQVQVKTSLDLALLPFRPEPGLVRSYSPDVACDQIRELNVRDTQVSFTIPKLDTYLVVSMDRSK